MFHGVQVIEPRAPNSIGSFILSFPRLSTRKSHRPQFLHKAGAISCCASQQSGTEWLHRKRERFLGSPYDCGRASGSRRFSRVNCRGTFRKYAQACTGCPGVAASSPVLLIEQERAAGHRTACNFVISGSRFAARFRQMRRASCALSGQKRLPPPSGGKGRPGTPRTMRPGGWPGRICFFCLRGSCLSHFVPLHFD